MGSGTAQAGWNLNHAPGDRSDPTLGLQCEETLFPSASRSRLFALVRRLGAGELARRKQRAKGALVLPARNFASYYSLQKLLSKTRV